MANINLGHATAYGYAKSKGYTGTEAEFAQLMADYAAVSETAVQASQLATSKAQEAGNYANAAYASAVEAANSVSEIEVMGEDLDDVVEELERLSLQSETYVDGGYVEEGVAYFVHGEDVLFEISGVGGGGGGGGGGSDNNAKLTVTNTTGWLSKTISYGGECSISANWSSIEDEMPTGDGVAKISVNGVVRATFGIHQGNVTFDIVPYLEIGSNPLKLQIMDIYGNARTIAFSVTVVSLSISSNFDASVPFTSDISFFYTPVGGNMSKVVYFVLDGQVLGTQTTTLSNRQLSYLIPSQSHGGHTLVCYFEAEINGETVRSNELYYEFISLETGNNNTVIVSSYNNTNIDQYDTINIPFRVYTPRSDTTDIEIYVNGTSVSTQTVDRTEQVFTYRADTAGTVTIVIEANRQTKQFTISVAPSSVEVEAETEDLVLYLTSRGRSNNQQNRDVWSNNGITATFSNFNWKRDGWQSDSDGITVLRTSGSSRVTIPYKPFERDFLATGKTIEIEFATRNVIDYSDPIITCMSDNIGFKLTSQEVTFSGAQTKTSTLYKDNEHIRVSFVIEKQTDNRLIYIYINGIMSRAIQYASGERFSQLTPVGITIGSSNCDVDIYNIRVYDNNLTRQQMLTNWIADKQIGSDLVNTYIHNDVYNSQGNIDISKLPNDLPYMIIEAAELPPSKGEKRIVSGSFTDPLHPTKNFTFTGCEADVQGTSSAPYYRKNYDMKFKQGFVTPSGTVDNYALRSGSIPFNRFVLKADVASSESTNNTGLTMFYNDTCPYKTPEMEEDSRVRWGIEGIPIVVYWFDTTTNTTSFLMKANFNLPKRAPDPLGYTGNMESWEWQRNNSDNVKFKDDDFTSTYFDTDTQTWRPSWYADFEARFPSDEWRDYAQLKELISWVKSTAREQATNTNLSSSVTYRVNSLTTVSQYPLDVSYTVVEEEVGGSKTGYYNITFTKDTPAYRLTKFRAEFDDYFERESVFFYYLFTELFLMIDSRAKNMFIGFRGEDLDIQNREMTRRAVCEPYDMDTAIGTNNSGVLMFSYSLEDTDTVSSVISGGDEGGSDAPVYNAQDSILWVNVRDAFKPELIVMFRNLRSSNAWNYNNIIEMYKNHQSKWCEAIFNEDAYSKYLVPLIDPVTIDEETGNLIRTDRYLTMLQGSKEEQRKWWLYNRFRYLDSKYVAGSATSWISARLFNSGTLTVTPNIDSYVNVQFGGGTPVNSRRTTANTPVSFTYNAPSGVTEMETYIYSADIISDIGDLSPFLPNEIDVSKATKLRNLKLGDGSPNYSNANLRTFNVSNSPLLETIDCRNCPNLAITVNLENSPRLREAYFEGTSITGVDLAEGGEIETLHLPSTITSLTLIDTNNLEELQVGSYSNISRLMLSNIDPDLIDPIEILSTIRAGSYVNIQGLNLEASDSEEIDEWIELFDSMQGITREKNANGEWIYHTHDKAQLSGTIHTTTLTGDQIDAYNELYPYLRFTATNTTTNLTYKSWDGSTTLKVVACQNGNPSDSAPTIPSRSNSPDGHYRYVPLGWNTYTDATVNDPNCLSNVTTNRTVYAAYVPTVMTYTVTWKNADNTVLETDYGVTWGTRPTYNSATPTYQGRTATGWIPAVGNITGDTTYTAAYVPLYTATFKTSVEDGNATLLTLQMQEGQTPQYTGATPTTTQGSSTEFEFIGWNPTPAPIYANTTYTAIFQDNRAATIQYLTGNIVEYNSDSVTTIRPYAFFGFSKLENVSISATNINDYAFSSCSKLKEIELNNTSPVTIHPYAFTTCSNFESLIIRSASIATFSSNNYNFRLSKIGKCQGVIYVPTNLISTYKSSAYFAPYIIASIDNYPLSHYDTIEDDWETIINNANYNNDYNIGDTKMLNLGSTYGIVVMELVAKNKDVRADGHGNARMTWISKNIIYSRTMNSAQTTSGGWESSGLRDYMNNNIKPAIPEVVRNAIVPVQKYSDTYEGGLVHNGQSTTDSVWIPSAQEILGGTNYETFGVTYSDYFSNANKRIKVASGDGDNWWLRSAVSNSNFRRILASGSIYDTYANYTAYIALGFCI